MTSVGVPSTAPGPFVALGLHVIALGRAALVRIDFFGATLIGIGRLVRGRTRHPAVRFVAAFQEAGVETLPVVGFFALASGIVLTILGVQQFDKVGVEALAPRIVGIVLLREFGALITGIAIAGRAASGYAAEIASAVARGDVEQLRREGGDPVDVLVAPRVLALTLTGPMLVAYANFIAMLAATAVGSAMMDVGTRSYLESTMSALNFKHAVAGLTKGAAFGFLAGLAACRHGLLATGPASIGRSVRNAVVAAVLVVAFADLVLTFVFKWVRL